MDDLFHGKQLYIKAQQKEILRAYLANKSNRLLATMSARQRPLSVLPGGSVSATVGLYQVDLDSHPNTIRIPGRSIIL